MRQAWQAVRGAMSRPWRAGVAVALVLGLVPAAAAQAVQDDAPAAVDDVRISVVYDGTTVPNGGGDTSTTNGAVATNDRIGFAWGGTFGEAGVPETFTQTLPEGWSWQAATVGVVTSDGSNGLYTSSGVISNGGRTLTVTVTPSQPDLTIEFRTLVAIPSTSASGTTFTPSLTVSDTDGTTTVTADTVDVLGQPQSTLNKAVTSAPSRTTLNGVEGYIATFRVTVAVPAASVGQSAGASLPAPTVFTDSWGGPTNSVLLVDAATNPGVTVTQTGTNSASFTLTNTVALASSTVVTYRVFWPLSEVPSAPAAALRVSNTVTPVDWAIAPTGTRTAAVNLQQPAAGTGTGPSVTKQLWVAKVATPTLPADPSFSSQQWAAVAANATQSVQSGDVVAARVYQHSAKSAAGDYLPYATVTLTDTWNPAQQQFKPGSVWVSTAGSVALDPAGYIVEYRTAATATWTADLVAAGGPAAVDGVRVTLTNPAPSQYLLMAAAFDVVAPSGTRPVTDSANARSVTTTGAVTSVSTTASYQVADAVLTISKVANTSTILSGAGVTYTLRADVVNPLGAEAASVADLTVTDLLPANVISADTSGLNPFWSVTRSTDATGRIQLTFTASGRVTSTDVVPDITIKVGTSYQAPSNSQMSNSATVSSSGGFSATATNVVTVQQSNVLTQTKVAATPVVEIGAPDVAWTISWFNFLTGNQATSHIVDVLPYNGDGRGTDFSGTLTLARLELTANTPANVSVEYTTADRSLVAATPANNPGGLITWLPVTDLNAPPADATALRVVIGNFVSGDTGTGNLRIVMKPTGEVAGDRYVNASFGYLGASDRPLATSQLATVDVIGSSVAGRVVLDVNDSASLDAPDTGLAGVTVRLLDGDGATVTTTTTAADGAYEFLVPSGSYRVTVEPATLPVTSRPTFDPAGDLDRSSGLVVVPRSGRVDSLNFGEFVPKPTGQVLAQDDPKPTPAPTPVVTSSPTRATGAVLATTGADPLTALLAAGVLAVVGGALLLVRRSPGSTPRHRR